MKRAISGLLLAHLILFGCGTADAAEPKAASGGPVFQWHFRGFDYVANGAEATTLRQIWALPETQAVVQFTGERLSKRLAEWLAPVKEGDPAPASELLEPLLQDFPRRETLIEKVEYGAGRFHWIFAVRVDEDSAELWSRAAGQLARDWRVRGWIAEETLAEGRIGNWQVLAISSAGGGRQLLGERSSSVLVGRLREKAALAMASSDSLLELKSSLDWLQSKQSPGNHPELSLAMKGKGATLRTEATVRYPEPVSWKKESWQIPTDLIRDPERSLISFTAFRGFAACLEGVPWIRDLKLAAPPNQLFVWGTSHLPFQVNAAVPLPNVKTIFEKIGQQWVPPINTNLAALALGEVKAMTDRSRLYWEGLPWIVPYIEATNLVQGDFMAAGIFPVEEPSTDPAPEELFRQITSRDNVIYYDWEITQFRLSQLRLLAQLISLIATLPSLDATSPVFRWLDAIETRLGNTVTEATLAGPRELQLVRTSHVGLNGLEIIALAYWLQSDQFPNLKWNVRMRPPERPGGSSSRP